MSRRVRHQSLPCHVYVWAVMATLAERRPGSQSRRDIVRRRARNMKRPPLIPRPRDLFSANTHCPSDHILARQTHQITDLLTPNLGDDVARDRESLAP